MKRFSWRARVRSFIYAFRGLAWLLRHEHNARLHLLATGLVLFGAWYKGFSAIKWAILCLTLGLVWAAEAFNSALERTLDRLHPERHPEIGLAKDLAAGAVLLTAIAALGVGLALFIMA